METALGTCASLPFHGVATYMLIVYLRFDQKKKSIVVGKYISYQLNYQNHPRCIEICSGISFRVP